MPIYTVDLSCRDSSFDYTRLFGRLLEANAMSFMDARWLFDVREDLDTVMEALLSLPAPGGKHFFTELSAETRWSGTGLDDEVRA